MDAYDWQAAIYTWCRSRPWNAFPLAESIAAFFRLAFEHTRCPERAWFGTHSNAVSLVVGGLYLAAINDAGGKDQGLWLLVDTNPPSVEGVVYSPVKSSQSSQQPLVWAHALSLDVIPQLLSSAGLWNSFERASARAAAASRAARGRDSVQRRRKKHPLNEIWSASVGSVFPDEVEPTAVYHEGARRAAWVNAYERDERARARCIGYYGHRCIICGFAFGEAYGPPADAFIHVHHLRALSEIGEEYVVDPINDLRPVCPNCHAVLHGRRPTPWSIEEVQEMLGGRVIRAVVPE